MFAVAVSQGFFDDDRIRLTVALSGSGRLLLETTERSCTVIAHASDEAECRKRKPRGGASSVLSSESSEPRHVGVAIENICIDMWRVTSVGGPGVDIWDMVEVRVRDHAFGDAFAKLLDLLADADEEGLGLPASGQHDAPSFVARECECHGRAGTNGMGADVGGFVAELGGPDEGDCGSKGRNHIGVGDGQEGPVAGGGVVVDEGVV